MLSDPQRKHLTDATKGLTDSLNKDQMERLYFLVDDILQYGCQLAALVIHKEIDDQLLSKE